MALRYLDFYEPPIFFATFQPKSYFSLPPKTDLGLGDMHSAHLADFETIFKNLEIFVKFEKLETLRQLNILTFLKNTKIDASLTKTPTSTPRPVSLRNVHHRTSEKCLSRRKRRVDVQSGVRDAGHQRT